MLIRVILPGLLLGILVGHAVSERDEYFRSMNPENWIDSLRENWLGVALKISVGLLAGVVLAYSFPVLDAAVTQSIGETVGDENFHVATRESFFFGWILLMIPAVVLEEWVTRRILIDELVRMGVPLFLTVVCSASLFSVLHLSLPGYFLPSLISIFFAGVYFSSIYVYLGFAPVVFAHLAYNLWPFVVGSLP